MLPNRNDAVVSVAVVRGPSLMIPFDNFALLCVVYVAQRSGARGGSRGGRGGRGDRVERDREFMERRERERARERERDASPARGRTRDRSRSRS